MNLLGIGSVIEAVGKVAGDLITTDKERLAAAIENRKLDLEERRIDQAIDLAQINVNKTEAATGSLFNGGWRPAIGWTCAISLFCYYVPYVLAATVLWVIQVIQTGQLMSRPDLGIADLLGLVFAMLGISSLRTAEKIKGVAAQ